MTDAQAADSHWLTERVEQIAQKVDALTIKVERLPTREELTASEAQKVDRPSYEIAHRALEQAVNQQAQLITTCQQAIARTSEQFTQEIRRVDKAHDDLTAQVKDTRRSTEELQQKPNAFRNSATFWVLVAGVAISALCGFSGVVMSALGLILRATTGH